MDMQKSSDFFSIISNIEGAAAPLEEIIATLFLFDEMLRNAVNWLNPMQPYTVELFKSRYEMLSAMLSILQRELGEHNNEIHKHITEAYRVHAEIKKQTAN